MPPIDGLTDHKWGTFISQFRRYESCEEGEEACILSTLSKW
jgi:hypothetical protein